MGKLTWTSPIWQPIATWVGHSPEVLVRPRWSQNAYSKPNTPSSFSNARCSNNACRTGSKGRTYSQPVGHVSRTSRCSFYVQYFCMGHQRFTNQSVISLNGAVWPLVLLFTSCIIAFCRYICLLHDVAVSSCSTMIYIAAKNKLQPSWSKRDNASQNAFLFLTLLCWRLSTYICSCLASSL